MDAIDKDVTTTLFRNVGNQNVGHLSKEPPLHVESSDTQSKHRYRTEVNRSNNSVNSHAHCTSRKLPTQVVVKIYIYFHTTVVTAVYNSWWQTPYMNMAWWNT